MCKNIELYVLIVWGHKHPTDALLSEFMLLQHRLSDRLTRFMRFKRIEIVHTAFFV